MYHDRSKFEEPEKSTYDKYIPLLKNVKYGSDEYNESDTDFEKGLEINCERFEINEQLAKIIFNTYKDLFKE